MKYLLPLLLLFSAFVNSGSISSEPSSAPPFRPGKDLALFFAVSNYDQWDDLQNPVKDAEAIAGDLSKYYAFDTLIVRNPTYDQVIEVLNRYTARTYADEGQLFVFFTGHGHLNTVKEGFFVPKDGLKNDASQRSYLAHNRIAYLVNNIPCKHILLGIDACYSGSFMRTIRQKGDIGRRPGETDAAVRDRFIQDMLQYKSRLVITSGGEVPTKDESQFARQILAALRSRGGESGILDFYSLVGYLQSARPTPRHGEFGDNEAGGQFLLVHVSATQNKTPGNSADSDGDGVLNADDACPDVFGTTKARGCPDADDDGVPDQSDKCKYDSGLARWQGCPDTDGDGMPDHEDKCPAEKGEVAFDGCPRPDNMVLIRGGTFQMGSNDGEADEKPVHTVTVSDFYMSKYEVTVAEFRAFIEATGHRTEAEREGTSRAYEDGKWLDKAGRNWRHDPEGNTANDNHPVINVSWNDATEYCKWLSQKTGKTYRLPTEAEWEYAAGNGSKHTKYSWGNENPAGHNGGNVADESKRPGDGASWSPKFEGFNDGYWYTAPIGSYKPNDFGLYDMTGNVLEWCSDWYGSDYYKNSPSQNPIGPTSGSARVCRGGSWDNDPQYCRVANRGYFTPDVRLNFVGFRLARTR